MGMEKCPRSTISDKTETRDICIMSSHLRNNNYKNYILFYALKESEGVYAKPLTVVFPVG